MRKYPSMVNISPAFIKQNMPPTDQNDSCIVNIPEGRKSPNFVQKEESKNGSNLNDISHNQESVSKSSENDNIIQITMYDNGQASDK